MYVCETCEAVRLWFGQWFHPVFLVATQLQALSIPATSINFNNLTMNSDKAICTRDGTHICIVDTLSGRVQNKLPQQGAESAIVSMDGKRLAVRCTSSAPGVISTRLVSHKLFSLHSRRRAAHFQP